MKKILFFVLLTLISCGKKKDSEETCRDHAQEGQCSKYLSARESNQTLPSYEGCAEAYKYAVDGKGHGKLAVMHTLKNGLVRSGYYKFSFRVRLLDEENQVIQEMSPQISSRNAQSLIHFDLEENKTYSVNCDWIADFILDSGRSYVIPGMNSIKTKLKPGSDSSREFFGCYLNSKTNYGTELSFVPNDKIEKILIKRNGVLIKELGSEDDKSRYVDQSVPAVGKEYKYTCDAVIAGKVQEGAYSVSVKGE